MIVFVCEHTHTPMWSAFHEWNNRYTTSSSGSHSSLVCNVLLSLTGKKRRYATSEEEEEVSGPANSRKMRWPSGSLHSYFSSRFLFSFSLGVRVRCVRARHPASVKIESRAQKRSGSGRDSFRDHGLFCEDLRRIVEQLGNQFSIFLFDFNCENRRYKQVH